RQRAARTTQQLVDFARREEIVHFYPPTVKGGGLCRREYSMRRRRASTTSVTPSISSAQRHAGMPQVTGALGQEVGTLDEGTVRLAVKRPLASESSSSHRRASSTR